MGSGASGGWGIGGVGVDRTVTEREILWGGSQASLAALWTGNAIIDGAARDAGATPTSLLRPGLLLGKITSSGKFIQWDANATDGSQFLAGVLDVEMKMIDLDGANADREIRVLVARAPLKANQLLVKGIALTSATDQYLARRLLAGAHFILDDDPSGALTGLVAREELNTTAAHTLTAADNGKTFFYSNVAAVAVTLPALAPGLVFNFVRTADEELVISSAGSLDDIVAGGDLSADSVTWTTAGQQIGAQLRIRSVYINTTTLKWLAEVVPAPYSTGAFLASSFA